MNEPDWLPELMPLQGDWNAYVEEVFSVFEADFINPRALFRNQEVRLRWMPVYKGKPSAFWHLIQEGQIEDERTPDLRRCERIAWIRAIIDNANDPKVKQWENDRPGSGGVQRQVLLWLAEQDFLVVLGKREGYYLLKTAYQTSRGKTREKLLKEYNSSRPKTS